MAEEYEKAEESLTSALDLMERQRILIASGKEVDHKFFTKGQKVALVYYLKRMIYACFEKDCSWFDLFSREDERLMRQTEEKLLEKEDIILQGLYHRIVEKIPPDRRDLLEIIEQQKYEHRHKNLVKHKKWLKVD